MNELDEKIEKKLKAMYERIALLEQSGFNFNQNTEVYSLNEIYISLNRLERKTLDEFDIEELKLISKRLCLTSEVLVTNSIYGLLYLKLKKIYK